MIENVLYIHGFNSSPLSLKAQQTKTYLNEHYPNIAFHCPQLLNQPKAAIAQLDEIITQLSNVTLIGSSLGGYFSTYFVEKYKLSAVLVNPAVRPYELLTDLLGEQTNPYTNETFVIESSFINDLKQLEQDKITKNCYQVMVQTGDEVLDYRQATEKYQACKVLLQQGGDHSFVNYEKMLPEIATFLRWG